MPAQIKTTSILQKIEDKKVLRNVFMVDIASNYRAFFKN